ncbi:hypothetical protein [Tateyamaria sp. syn59]|uniref:hypothetical protein n=1 Tax=Tateyamaria sp. syn59 TaxID=2576942 RepID=UPI0011BE424B|nr:hypothetical protein [Tateyamaria sp. syn59]
MFKALSFSALALTVICQPAFANGVGESSAYQFRSFNERQVGLNSEATRLNFLQFDRGVGSSFGLGSQIGNTITIDIDGDGDNDITLDQENQGDQSTEE